jgi:hypothetical protein
MHVAPGKPLHDRSSFVLALAWETCPLGFEVVDLPPEPSKYFGGFLEGGPHFRAQSAERRSYKISADNPDDLISLRFVNARSDERMLTFLNRFGLPLAYDRMRDEELFRKRDQLYGFVAEYLEDGEAADLISEPIDKFLLKFSLVPRVVVGSPDSLRLELHPKSLLQYMFLELILASSVGARATKCESCGDSFLVGRLTGRRRHSRFCSDRCRVAKFRALRK